MNGRNAVWYASPIPSRGTAGATASPELEDAAGDREPVEAGEAGPAAAEPGELLERQRLLEHFDQLVEGLVATQSQDELLRAGLEARDLLLLHP
jgi:hypothetical protein